MLYVVGTPIGNLGDMSPRAVDTLKKAALIAAEDTRVTRKLLTHFDIHTPLVSNHEHNEETRARELAARMAEEGIDIALVTDAGMPAISDPGAVLVREAARVGVEICVVPGPCAFVSAVALSGLAADELTFAGFPPRAAGELKDYLSALSRRARLAALYESPHRVVALMRAVAALWPDLPVSASCDVTKLHECTLRGEASAVLQKLADNPKTEKGEYCVVLDFSHLPPEPVHEARVLSLEARLMDGLSRGLNMRQAMDEVQGEGEKRNAVYAARLRLLDIMEKASEAT